MFVRNLIRISTHGRASRCVRFTGTPRYVSDLARQAKQTSSVDDALPSKKELKNLPFAKDLYLGKFDIDMLIFPEVLSMDELDELHLLTQPIEKYFLEDLDSAAIDTNAKIPPEVLQQIKDLGLFGQQIPEEYGGLGLNATQYARIAEFTSLDASIGVTLAAHQAIGLKGILIFGNEQQKQKYLPTLATGEKVAAFALTEPSSGSDAASVKTRATRSDDGKTFNLTGSKIWISNGGIADVFTVFAKTEVTNEKGDVKDKITAFIVERGFGGVSNGKPEDKLGIRGSNTVEVNFDNTPVPIENVLGEVGDGFKVAMNILNSGRFSMGSSVAGSLRNLMAMTLEHAKSRTQFGKKLTEFGLIQEKFARMAVYTYVMESMAFRTAAIMDMYEEPDASVEAAMVKVFSSEHAWILTSEAMQVLGGLGYMKDYPYERLLRDSRILLIFEGTNEILRMFIALTCLQHAGVELKDLVKRMKKPFNNLGLTYKKIIEHMFLPPKIYLLKHKVHPNLGDDADRLEGHVVKLKIVVEKSLMKHSKAIVDEQMLLKRLADISIEIYAQTCTLARASRSKCMGFKHCDHEVMLAQTFCKESFERIEYCYTQLEKGKFKNGDQNYEEIAELIFKNDGYVAQHPLTRHI